MTPTFSRVILYKFMPIDSYSLKVYDSYFSISISGYFFFTTAMGPVIKD